MEDPDQGGNGNNFWLALGVAGAVFVLTAIAIVVVHNLTDTLREDRLDSISDLRHEVRENEREQLNLEEVRAISLRLIEAKEVSPAQRRRELNRHLRRLTVRQRQQLINSLLRVATRRQKRLLSGIVQTRQSNLTPTPRVGPQPTQPTPVTPPRIVVPRNLPPVTQRPPVPRDDDGDRDEGDRDRDRDNNGEIDRDRRGGE